MPAASDAVAKGRSSTNEILADGLLTLADAAARLKVSVKTLYRGMERGEIRYVQPFRKRFIPVREVERILAASLRGGWAKPL